MSIEQVLMQIKDGPSSQWPQPMLALVEGLDISRYCRFHQYHEHRIDKCWTFKKGRWRPRFVKKKKKLREFVHTDNTKTPMWSKNFYHLQIRWEKKFTQSKKKKYIYIYIYIYLSFVLSVFLSLHHLNDEDSTDEHKLR